MEIYERIRARRIELGITQEELGKMVGYTHRSTTNKTEKGINDIPCRMLPKYAEALQTTVGYLVGAEETALTEEEKDIISRYREMPAQMQEAVRALCGIKSR